MTDHPSTEPVPGSDPPAHGAVVGGGRRGLWWIIGAAAVLVPLVWIVTLGIVGGAEPVEPVQPTEPADRDDGIEHALDPSEEDDVDRVLTDPDVEHVVEIGERVEVLAGFQDGAVGDSYRIVEIEPEGAIVQVEQVVRDIDDRDVAGAGAGTAWFRFVVAPDAAPSRITFTVERCFRGLCPGDAGAEPAFVTAEDWILDVREVAEVVEERETGD